MVQRIGDAPNKNPLTQASLCSVQARKTSESEEILICCLSAAAGYGLAWLLIYPFLFANFCLLHLAMGFCDPDSDGTWVIALHGMIFFAETFVFAAFASWFAWRFVTKREQLRQQHENG